MFKAVSIKSRTEIRVALFVLTSAAVALSLGLAVVALWITTSGDPDAVIPERQIWSNTIFFATLIPGIVCPVVTHKLLNTLRELHEARSLLDEMARKDPLTGLLNRRGFDAAAAEMIEQSIARHEQLAALLCDIDHFKQINDTYGHACGDKAIQHVASLLKTISIDGRTAVIGRQGGEEFAIIMAGGTARDFAHVAEGIRSAISSTPLLWDQGTVHFTISIGMSLSPPVTASVHSLLSRADAALYEAKTSGRNRVVEAFIAAAA